MSIIDLAVSPTAAPSDLDPRARALRDEVLRRLAATVGKDRNTASERDWFVAVALATRDRIVNDWMRFGAERLSRESPPRLLSVAGIPDRPPADRRAHQSRPGRADARGARRPRHRPRQIAQCRAGRGARQRRPRAPRRLFHGEHGDARPSPPTAMASATTTACSARPSPTAGSTNIPRTGWISAIRGSSPAPRSIYNIGFGGDVDGAPRPTTARLAQSGVRRETVEAVAYDTPVVGWRGTARQYACGCGRRARRTRCASTSSTPAIMSARWPIRCARNSISKILYPSDSTPAGQELRLRQEYFFASASLQDLIRRHLKQNGDIRNAADKVAIQLNDTHPAIGVAELMRLLVDVHGARLERRLGDHPGDLLLHQPHPAARGAGDLAGRR